MQDLPGNFLVDADFVESFGLGFKNRLIPSAREERRVGSKQQPLRAGDWLRIKLYFDPNFLEPIVLYGRVASAIPDDATGGCGVQAELVETSLETEEAVARLAFLAQRRQLAHRPLQAARASR